jgi:integrase
MSQPNSSRRQRRGSAWYWQQTDCWYYTPRGSKARQALWDEDGRRIRGAENKHAAQLALARVRIQQGLRQAAELETSPTAGQEWVVARVCAEYLSHCERATAAGRMHPDYHRENKRYLNELCRYCGALPVAELKRGQVREWVESHPTWRSPVTRRNVITRVLAAFYFVEEEHQVRNPIRGLKKPPPRPRLHSLSAAEEQEIYGATDQAFGQFLFAAIYTGLRPFCELAKLTAEMIEETPRGMMWRVYSSKTKKTRKVPVRPEVAKLTRKLLKQAPRGSGKPIFQNPQGQPWKKGTGVGRFLAIKRVLGWDQDATRRRYSTYSCRHTFAHRMLSGFWNQGAGCSIETLAELMGDTPKVAFDHYGKEWGQHYQEPLWAAIGE